MESRWSETESLVRESFIKCLQANPNDVGLQNICLHLSDPQRDIIISNITIYLPDIFTMWFKHDTNFLSNAKARKLRINLIDMMVAEALQNISHELQKISLNAAEITGENNPSTLSIFNGWNAGNYSYPGLRHLDQCIQESLKTILNAHKVETL